MNILKAMDDISAGKIDTKTKTNVLPEVEIVANKHAASPEQTKTTEPEAKNNADESAKYDNTDNIFEGFKLDFTPPTYEQLYEIYAPELIKQGYSEAAIKNLNYTALRELDEVGASILRDPDNIDWIFEGLEQKAGKEVRDQVFEALMSNPDRKKIIIEKAKGQSDEIRWSTNNWDIEDAEFKKTLSKIGCIKEYYALERRLNYDIENAPENLKPRYEALKNDLSAKGQELVINYYTHVDEGNFEIPLPQTKDFKKIITGQIQKCDDIGELQHLSRDLESYSELNPKEDFTDIDKMIEKQRTAIYTQKIKKHENPFKSF